MRRQLEEDCGLFTAALNTVSSSSSGQAKCVSTTLQTYSFPDYPPGMKYLSWPKWGKSQGASELHLSGSEMVVVSAMACITSAGPLELLSS